MLIGPANFCVIKTLLSLLAFARLERSFTDFLPGFTNASPAKLNEEYFVDANIKPVALVSMPCLSARFPSFQLALLKPTLEKAGIPVQPFSLFMYLGSQIGWRLSETIG